jgi:(p)ppGpp synthase/HD superfamily hydrolase
MSISFESDNSKNRTYSKKITTTYNFTQKSHEDKFRKSGEPYFTHCV